ncbi:MAG: dTDP-glucose 4,6-dehydratase [Desulfobacterales bacterium]|nr:dTDP-glucose 4,6-dehydratase [Desulfobacterales bacterium]
MKNLLVTGGCGFIGSNFIRFLLPRADFTGRIVNLDNLTYAGNAENLTDMAQEYPDRYVFERGDVCDPLVLADIFSRHDIDAVCHFAAESHVDRSITGPDAFIQTNIVGTFQLLEQARRLDDRLIRFHHVSTDEVYGSLGAAGHFTEQTPYRPNSPYSASKASSDHLVRAYAKTYGLPVTLSNCSNNYGPFQFPEKLIPLMVLNALEQKPLPVYGDGKNVRDWLYVVDHCRAIWEILVKGREGETYNIGGDCEMENIDVVKSICDIVDKLRPEDGQPSRRDLITFVVDRPGHDRRYAIDSSKIRDELGWTPAENFASGMAKTVGWYLDHGDWIDRVRSGEYRRWIETQYGSPG